MNKVLIITLLIIVIALGVALYVLVVEKSATNSIPETDSTMSQIYWSPGWKKIKTEEAEIYQGLYGGLEFSFDYSGLPEISIYAHSPSSRVTSLMDVWIDDIKYTVNNLELAKLEKLSGNDSQTDHFVKGVMYCTGNISNHCDIHISDIQLSDNAVISNKKQDDKKLLFVLGDSISVNHANENYIYDVAEKLNLKLVNHSSSGVFLKNSTGIIPVQNTAISEIALHNPDIILIAMGTNDLTQDTTAEQFNTNYQTLLVPLVKMNPDIPIVMLGILPRTDVDEDKIIQFNNTISNNAQKHPDVHYIDTYTWITEEDLDDTVHPSKDAQEKLANKLVKEIQLLGLIDE